MRLLGVRVLHEAMDLVEYMPQYTSYPQVTFMSLLTKGHIEMVKLVGFATHMANG